MVEVFEVQLAESLKRLESDFRRKGARVSKKMKKFLEDCIRRHTQRRCKLRGHVVESSRRRAYD